MWPWGHLAVGYLVYSGVQRHRTGSPPTAPGVIALAIGTQFPDLVDKPLGWTFGVFPSGRTLAHSLLTAALIATIGYLICRRRGCLGLVGAFSLGQVSHSLSDLSLHTVLHEPANAGFLLWPLYAVPPPEGPPSIVARFIAFEAGTSELVQFLLFGIAVVVWYWDGCPGVEDLRRFIHSGDK